MLNQQTSSPQRCRWATNDSLYIDYHDNEWGKLQHDSLKLFEKICLEGQQAGLSWITVLRKRDEYRRCFFNFEPQKIIGLTQQDIEVLLKNKGLIRNRLKLNAIIKNAYAYLNMLQNGGDFSHFIWSFVGSTICYAFMQSMGLVNDHFDYCFKKEVAH